MRQISLKKTVIALFALVSVLGSAISVSAEDTITVAPENVLNIQVVDENGNTVDDVDMSLVDSSGNEVAKWTSNKKYVQGLNGSGITSNRSFNVPRSRFEALVAPYTLAYIKDSLSNEYSGSGSFDEAQGRILELGYAVNNETALTVDGNTLVTAVDAGWASRYWIGWIENNYEDIYTFNDNAGKITCYPVDESSYSISFWLENDMGGIGSDICGLVISSEPTEYIKIRVKLSDILSDYDSVNDIITVNGRDYNFKSDNVNSSSILVFASGSVITAPVPDEQGYVEVYVEKSTREYYVSDEYAYDDVTISGGGGGNIDVKHSAYDTKEVIVKAIDYPDEGTNLMNVSSGDYTVEFNNLPDTYKPVTKAIAVAESDNVQTFKIVLEKNAQITTEAATEQTAAESTEKVSVPNTGDTMPAMIGIIMLTVIVLALVVLFALKNKKRIF